MGVHEPLGKLSSGGVSLAPALGLPASGLPLGLQGLGFGVEGILRFSGASQDFMLI